MLETMYCYNEKESIDVMERHNLNCFDGYVVIYRGEEDNQICGKVGKNGNSKCKMLSLTKEFFRALRYKELEMWEAEQKSRCLEYPDLECDSLIKSSGLRGKAAYINEKIDRVRGQESVFKDCDRHFYSFEFTTETAGLQVDCSFEKSNRDYWAFFTVTVNPLPEEKAVESVRQDVSMPELAKKLEKIISENYHNRTLKTKTILDRAFQEIGKLETQCILAFNIWNWLPHDPNISVENRKHAKSFLEKHKFDKPCNMCDTSLKIINMLYSRLRKRVDNPLPLENGGKEDTIEINPEPETSKSDKFIDAIHDTMKATGLTCVSSMQSGKYMYLGYQNLDIPAMNMWLQVNPEKEEIVKQESGNIRPKWFKNLFDRKRKIQKSKDKVLACTEKLRKFIYEYQCGPDDIIRELLTEFDANTIARILASNVRDIDYSDMISNENKAWAKNQKSLRAKCKVNMPAHFLDMLVYAIRRKTDKPTPPENSGGNLSKQDACTHTIQDAINEYKQGNRLYDTHAVSKALHGYGIDIVESVTAINILHSKQAMSEYMVEWAKTIESVKLKRYLAIPDSLLIDFASILLSALGIEDNQEDSVEYVERIDDSDGAIWDTNTIGNPDIEYMDNIECWQASNTNTIQESEYVTTPKSNTRYHAKIKAIVTSVIINRVCFDVKAKARNTGEKQAIVERPTIYKETIFMLYAMGFSIFPIPDFARGKVAGFFNPYMRLKVACFPLTFPCVHGIISLWRG